MITVSEINNIICHIETNGESLRAEVTLFDVLSSLKAIRDREENKILDIAILY